MHDSWSSFVPDDMSFWDGPMTACMYHLYSISLQSKTMHWLASNHGWMHTHQELMPGLDEHVILGPEKQGWLHDHRWIPMGSWAIGNNVYIHVYIHWPADWILYDINKHYYIAILVTGGGHADSIMLLSFRRKCPVNHLLTFPLRRNLYLIVHSRVVKRNATDDFYDLMMSQAVAYIPA